MLDPAHDHAERGFACSASQGDFLTQKWAELGGFQALTDHYAPDGRPPPAGANFQQPHLAESLRLLQRDGAEGFYRGELGWRIAHGLADAGSLLSAADLAAFQGRQVKPIGVPYRNGRAVNMPPPTQGLASLLILGQLDHFDLTRHSHRSADYVHLVVEATKQAFRVRDRHVADPEHVDVPVADLLSPERIAGLAAEIDMARAAPWGQGVGPADTVWFGVVDGHGRAVSAIQSIYHEYGSGVVAGETGILWQNRGTSFSLDPRHVNVLKPGKRPFHTLNPAMYLENGRPRLVYGTMGGDGQPQTQAMLFSRHVMFRQPLPEAIEAPRWLLGRTWGSTHTNLRMESRFGGGLIDRLMSAGHDVAVLDEAFSDTMGHAGAAILHSDGTMEAAHYPRADPGAFGV